MIECPVPGGLSDCPYYCDFSGFCALENPREECDEYYCYAEVGDEE